MLVPGSCRRNPATSLRSRVPKRAACRRGGAVAVAAAGAAVYRRHSSSGSPHRLLCGNHGPRARDGAAGHGPYGRAGPPPSGTSCCHGHTAQTGPRTAERLSDEPRRLLATVSIGLFGMLGDQFTRCLTPAARPAGLVQMNQPSPRGSKPQAINKASSTSRHRDSANVVGTAPKRARCAMPTWSKFRAQLVGIPSLGDWRTSVERPRIVRVAGTAMSSFRVSITASRVRSSTGRRLSGDANVYQRISPRRIDQDSSQPSPSQARGLSAIENSSAAGGAA